MRRLLWIVPVVVAGFVVVVLWPRPQTPTAGPDPIRKNDSTKVSGYKAGYRNDQFKAEPTSVQVKTDETPLVAAVTEMLDQDKLFQKKVKLLNATLQGNTATLSFSKELRGGYSTDEEEALLKTLLTTCGQFPRIAKVRILVEGQPVDTLSSVDLSEPLDVIRPER